MAAPLGLVALAACGGTGGGDDDRSGNSPIEGAPTLDVVGDDLRYERARLTVDARQFNVAFTAEDIFHTFVIENADGDEVVAAARPGEIDRGGVELDAGEYVYYCDVPGHREGGMEGILTVE